MGQKTMNSMKGSTAEPQRPRHQWLRVHRHLDSLHWKTTIVSKETPSIIYHAHKAVTLHKSQVTREDRFLFSLFFLNSSFQQVLHHLLLLLTPAPTLLLTRSRSRLDLQVPGEVDKNVPGSLLKNGSIRWNTCVKMNIHVVKTISKKNRNNIYE